MLERGLARRADVPCPECYIAQPGILSRNYVKLLKRPRAEVGRGGIGLKIQIDMQQRVEYEARPVGSMGCLAWHMLRG